MKNKKITLIVIVLLILATIASGLLFVRMKNMAYYKKSYENLKFISQAMALYKDDFGTYPYSLSGNSDKIFLSLLKGEEAKQSPQLLSCQLENPKIKKNSEIFYETFNFSKEEWDKLNGIWKQCMYNADFSVKRLPLVAPTLWEKYSIHPSDNLLYVDRGMIETCKDGKNFLKLVKMVKKEIELSKAQTASDLKAEKNNPQMP